MRKYIFACFLLVCYSLQSFANNVIITAKVGSQNSSPVILSVNPASNPRILWTGKYQNYTIYFRDDEKNSLHFTINPEYGSVNPYFGNISSQMYDSQSGAYIQFTYLAPLTPANNEKIMITLDDGWVIKTHQLNLYIY